MIELVNGVTLRRPASGLELPEDISMQAHCRVVHTPQCLSKASVIFGLPYAGGDLRASPHASRQGTNLRRAYGSLNTEAHTHTVPCLACANNCFFFPTSLPRLGICALASGGESAHRTRRRDRHRLRRQGEPTPRHLPRRCPQP